MLVDCGLRRDSVREIHAMEWSESKYVLVSLERNGRMRTKQMGEIVKSVEARYNAKSLAVMGYDSITSNTTNVNDQGILIHPGFKRLIQLLKDDPKNKDVRSWVKMEGGTDESLKKRGGGRGFLKRSLVGADDDIETMSKTQLRRICLEWKPLVEAYSVLQSQISELETKNQKLEADLQAARLTVV